MILSVEILRVFGRVVGLGPRVGVGGRLYLRDESGACGRHLAIGVGIVVIEEELHILGGDLAARLVVYEFKRYVVRVYI